MARSRRLNARRVRAHVIKSIYQRVFPVREDFRESQWDTWIDRIGDGQKKEEEYIANLISGLPRDEYVEIFADDYYHSIMVTDSMYAALIVTMWSEMESFFKSLIRLCQYDLGLTGQTPFAIKGIKEFFKNNLDIELNTIEEYGAIDAIRILNNSFKHNKGKYEAAPSRPWDHMDCALQNKWGLKKDEKIKYSELPIEDLVVACNTFTAELLGQAIAELKNRDSAIGGP